MTVLSNIITPSNVLTTTNTATVTNKTFGDNPTFSGGTANGVTFLNGSKVLTSGSALTYNGTSAQIGDSLSAADGSRFYVYGNIPVSTQLGIKIAGNATTYAQQAIRFYDTYTEQYAGYVGFTPSSLTFGQGTTEGMRLTSTGLGIGTSSPVAKNHIRGSGTSGQVTASWMLENASSGTSGMDITGSAGASRWRFLYGNGPSTGTNTLTEAMCIGTEGSSAGNLGIGTSSPSSKLDVSGVISLQGTTLPSAGTARIFSRSSDSSLYLQAASGGTMNFLDGSQNSMLLLSSSTLQFLTGNTERARIDSSGNLLVGTTSALLSGYRGIQVDSTGDVGVFKTSIETGNMVFWNTATSGNNNFTSFYTETSITGRGSITYNRAGGLVAYNTTSDYRAKDITGPVTGSGALIDSVPVYMGKMKGATQERPMFLAHETPNYAHTGVKDAVDADGKPVYQQMDASALIPVMWAEIQSLRQRLSAANL